MWRRPSFYWDLVLVLLSIVVAVAATALLDWPEEGWLRERGPLFWLVIGSAIAVPLGGVVRAVTQERRTSQLRKEIDDLQLAKDLNVACDNVVAAIADECPEQPLNDLAIQVWLCRRDETFDRRVRWHLLTNRKSSGIVWRRGRGVAGLAWEIDQDLVHSLGELRGLRESLGDEGFNALPSPERLGLTSAEVAKTRHYQGIAAYRLFAEGNDANLLLGLFVIDHVGTEADFKQLEPVLKESKRLRSAIGACERVLSAKHGKLGPEYGYEQPEPSP